LKATGSRCLQGASAEQPGFEFQVSAIGDIRRPEATVSSQPQAVAHSGCPFHHRPHSFRTHFPNGNSPSKQKFQAQIQLSLSPKFDSPHAV